MQPDASLTSEQRIQRLEREVATLRAQLGEAQSSYARLKQAYTEALEQLQLLRRRLFVAKAERRDTRAEQLAFDSMLAKVETLAQQLDTAEAQTSAGDPPAPEKDSKDKKRPARRDLAEHELPVERVELLDPLNEGAVERIGFEESSKLAWQRGGFRRVVIARAVYKTSEARSAPDVAAQIVTVPMPRELVKRGLLAPSMIAHVLASKYVLGVPFYRQEQQYALQGFGLDRGTMSRYAEQIGATLGCVVEAMAAEARATAFCLSTDATGVSIQLGELKERERGPCRKGHFFVVLADRDHVFFEYQPKHTSAVVCEMFADTQAICRRTHTRSTTRCSRAARRAVNRTTASAVRRRSRWGVGATRDGSSGKRRCANTRWAWRACDESMRCSQPIARSRTCRLRSASSRESSGCAPCSTRSLRGCELSSRSRTSAAWSRRRWGTSIVRPGRCRASWTTGG